MSNDAFADDPDLRVTTSDDPDSLRLKAFLKRWVFPGVGGFAVVTLLALFVIKAGWAIAIWKAAGLAWLAAQLLLRPVKFALSVRDGFGAATKTLANLFGYKGDPRAAPTVAQARRFMPQAHAAPAAAPAPSGTRRSSIDWFRFGDGVIRALPFIAVAVVLFLIVPPVLRWIDGPTGDEVRAEWREANAESEQRTSNAEAERAEEAIVIVEDTGARRQRARAQTEEAREAVALAADLETSVAEYRTRAVGLREQGRAPAADAVRQHTAGLAP